MALGLPLPCVAAAFGLLLGFDVVTVVADGSQVVRVARVSAFGDWDDLVDDVRFDRASRSADLTLVAVAFEDAESEFAPFVCMDELAAGCLFLGPCHCGLPSGCFWGDGSAAAALLCGLWAAGAGHARAKDICCHGVPCPEPLRV
jgi:hypothetical protein